MNKQAIEQEIDRIARALRDPQTDARYCQLYAAQQALVWAVNPQMARSPFETIQLDLVQPLRPVATGDYRIDMSPARFKDGANLVDPAYPQASPPPGGWPQGTYTPGLNT